MQALTIPDWAGAKTQVNSLWVSILIGRPAWSSRSEALDGVPALVVGARLDHHGRGRRKSRIASATACPQAPGTRARHLIISSTKVTWVAPGWAVVTYDVPASTVSPRGVDARIAEETAAVKE